MIKNTFVFYTSSIGVSADRGGILSFLYANLKTV